MALTLMMALHDLERQASQLANELGTLYDTNVPRVAGSVMAMNPSPPPSAEVGRKPETVLERILDVSAGISRMGRAVVDMNAHFQNQLSSDGSDRASPNRETAYSR